MSYSDNHDHRNKDNGGHRDRDQEGRRGRDQEGRHNKSWRERGWTYDRKGQSSVSARDREQRWCRWTEKEEMDTGGQESQETERDGEYQSTTGSDRPPPGLRGREIGMWYARRSQARKLKEQKTNRSTVSFDHNKESKLRHLLNNLQSRDGNSSLPSHLLQGSRSTSSRTETEDIKPRIKEEPVDNWETLGCTGKGNGSGAAAVNTGLQDDAVVDLDGFDDDGRPLPSVSGVVEYLRAHGDYPYGGDSSDYGSSVSDWDNPLLNTEMSRKMKELQENQQFVNMLQFRRKLPSYTMRDTIVSTVGQNQVVVISGETGCGKTTQVPQFILDDFIARGAGSQCRIVCTQPRRISAISVAERVAAERCEKVDTTGTSSVGYHIRLEVKRPRPQGSILFCTTGIVLKFLESDSCLRRATHILLDEIHERDLQSDFLMIILKDLLPQRPDLRVILMSATVNAEMFSQYFNGCPMLNIPGYTFPVKELYLEDVIEVTRYTTTDKPRPPPWRQRQQHNSVDEDYQVWCRTLRGRYSQRTIEVLQNFDYNKINLDLLQHTVNYICNNMEEGAILVFVPGWEEIRKLNEMIQASARCRTGSILVIPLHSLMPTVNQREVFDRPPPGVRKIVIATNIAETSITIDDVVYVLDSGKIKINGFLPEMNLTCLQTVWVSKANTKQRKGRAGRVQPGHCFHLYTKFRDDLLPDSHPPEMLRTRLEELCLQIKLLHLGQIVPFVNKAMQHPTTEAVEHAIRALQNMNALDSKEELLPLGYHLARMPVEPHVGKMILFGAMFCCLDPILTVAASLGFKDAFIIPLGKEALADQRRCFLSKGSKSDHIMLINTFKGWEQSLSHGSSRSYCWENFLAEHTLKMLRDMKKQLAELLFDIGFVATKTPKDTQANINSENLALVRAVLCAGLYPNVARVTNVPGPKTAKYRGVSMVSQDNSKMEAHPKSVNQKQTFFESAWLVFYHKLKTTKVYIHDSTMVSPYTLLFFGGEITVLREDQTELVSMDNWVTFKASASTAHLVKDLRLQLDRLLTSKVTRPGPTKWDKDSSEGALMAAIADLITTEDLDNSQRVGDLGGSVGRKP